MDDLARRMVDARHDVAAVWTDEQAQRARAGVTRGVRRRARVRTATLALSALMLVGLAGAGLTRVLGGRGGGGVGTEAAAGVLREADGTVSVPLGAQSVVRYRERTASRVVVELARGSARFDVTRGADRVFRVEAGDVAVQVLGTAFVVERVGPRAQVAVTHGRVRVFYAGRFADLGAGERGSFPREDPGPDVAARVVTATTAETAEPPATAPAREASGERRAARAAEPASSWRALAARNDFERAYAALALEGARAVRDEPGDLALAADVARSSRHYDEAVRYLRRVLERFAGDPHAPPAAFTLGRVLLENVGRAPEAAEAFALARRLDARGAIAEPSLAREVEALARGGDAARARARAEEYLRLFPDGPRRVAVQRAGGL